MGLGIKLSLVMPNPVWPPIILLSLWLALSESQQAAQYNFFFILDKVLLCIHTLVWNIMRAKGLHRFLIEWGWVLVWILSAQRITGTPRWVLDLPAEEIKD